MDTADRILQDIMQTANAHAELVRTGAKAAELRIHPVLRNLGACYRKAHRDGLSIPVDVRDAIERVLQLIPEPPAQEPRYQERRDGGGDRSIYGTRLEPGS